MSELVSILIASYDAERWLGEAIESALQQTYPHVEVIVIDDGSTDGTCAVAHSYEERGVKVIHQENQGACAARNRALAEASGIYIKFLDADDVLVQDTVRTQLESLTGFDSEVCPYGDMVPVDEALRPLVGHSTNAPLPEHVFSTDRAERIEALLTGNIQTSLPLHRRDVLLEVGGFRPHLKRGQEYDLHIRLALAGIRFMHVPNSDTYVRQHESEGRITNTSPLFDAPEAYLVVQVERRELIEKELGVPLPQPIVAALAQGIWKHTRRLVQAGEDRVVKQYVEEGMRLDPDMAYTGRVFRLLSKLSDPVRAERVLMAARTLLRRS